MAENFIPFIFDKDLLKFAKLFINEMEIQTWEKAELAVPSSSSKIACINGIMSS